EVAFVQTTAILETPFQDFFIAAALQNALAQLPVINAKKITANAVGLFRASEIFVVIRAKFVAPVQANLVEHAREIQHAARLLVRALGVGAHGITNESDRRSDQSFFVILSGRICDHYRYGAHGTGNSQRFFASLRRTR